MVQPAGVSSGSSDPPTWASLAEAIQVIRYPRHLARTVAVTLVVGTILFAINQLDVVLVGDADAMTWVKTVATYVVPFCVANYGILTATRRRPQTEPGQSPPTATNSPP